MMILVRVPLFAMIPLLILGTLAVSTSLGAQEPAYGDFTSVLLEIKEAQEVFLERLDGVSDHGAIGIQCDSLGARLEALNPRLTEALEAHPELAEELPEGVAETVEDSKRVWMEWDGFMNATVLPLANELADDETFQAAFGRLNAAVFYMKYGRRVMTLGRGI
jgi:hypothetical protein